MLGYLLQLPTMELKDNECRQRAQYQERQGRDRDGENHCQATEKGHFCDPEEQSRTVDCGENDTDSEAV